MIWTPEIVLLFLGVGLLAGTVAGFVGVGGGVIMVPVLLEIFRHQGLPAVSLTQAAMGTSLAVAVLSVSSSTVRHSRQGRVRWAIVPYLAPGCLFGGWLAARLATVLPGTWLQLSLAVLMTFAAFRMFTQKEYQAKEQLRISRWSGLLVGFGVGLVAGMSGLAGGIVLVPALTLILGLHTGWLAGTSSATIIFSSLAAALGYLSTQPPTPLPAGFTGYVCLPMAACLAVASVPGAQLGAWLNRRTGGTVFRRIFAVLLLLVVIRLISGLI